MTPSPLGACGARDWMLDAAEALARSVGAANLTLDAVAQAAGVSKGGLPYQFPSKDALLAAMLERDVGRVDESGGRVRETLGVADAAAELKASVMSMLQPDPLRRDMEPRCLPLPQTIPHCSTACVNGTPHASVVSSNQAAISRWRPSSCLP